MTILLFPKPLPSAGQVLPRARNASQPGQGTHSLSHHGCQQAAHEVPSGMLGVVVL
jgi:hypothetical protein